MLFGKRLPRLFIGYPLKRVLDLVVSGVAIICLSPILIVVAIAVKATSKGPIFFHQRRLGFQEDPFRILKFRSMRQDADKHGPAYTEKDDPRITPVGRLLRKTSLDELPQLFNVFCGEMSLLGPRPYAGFELDDWSDVQREVRAAVRPGISGLAQIRGRSSLTVDKAREFDLEYVQNCSLTLDLRLLVETLLAVCKLIGTN